MLRRPAICGLEQAQLNYLVRFHELFDSEWRRNSAAKIKKDKKCIQSPSRLDIDSIRGFSRGNADGGPAFQPDDR